MPTVRTVSKTISIILLFLFILIWPGCSVKKNFKTLSFFFDGVPEPGTKSEAGSTKGRDSSPARKRTGTKPDNWVKIVSHHKPYAEKKCAECHNTRSISFLRQQKEKLCFSCHEKEKYTGEFLHGPVSVGACLACHLPHESKYERLLKANTPQLCIDCHTAWDRRDVKTHSKGKTCIQCHNPHAGSNRFFLTKIMNEGRGTRDEG